MMTATPPTLILGRTPAPPARRHRSRSMVILGGGQPVLILIGIRLGLDGTNPIYCYSIKV